MLLITISRYGTLCLPSAQTPHLTQYSASPGHLDPVKIIIVGSSPEAVQINALHSLQKWHIVIPVRP